MEKYNSSIRIQGVDHIFVPRSRKTLKAAEMLSFAKDRIRYEEVRKRDAVQTNRDIKEMPKLKQLSCSPIYAGW